MKRTSTEAHVYMRRHQGAEVKHFDVSNVIYHRFSHGAVSYTLNGENVNVMLELCLIFSYGENLIAPCSQVHDNFTMGVDRKILVKLIYLFIQETYLTCANELSLLIIYS